MYVGRTVCGLPSDRPDIALLPPRFRNGSTDTINSALDLCFPGLPANLRLIAEHALASVIFHRDYLKRTVPAGHPLLKTLPFRSDAELIQELEDCVVCTLPDPEEGLRATGVPPHVSMMHSFSTVSSKVDEGIRLQSVHAKDIVAEVATRIVRELEDRDIGAGTVTTDGLKSALMDCLRASTTVVLGNQQARQDGGADAEEANLNEQPAGNHHRQEAGEDRGRSLFF
ncbi:hypothetical protein PsorP6_016688 [Peronosclerospora sorghi]|uniref:Uncharacterized protein n=1 Tax=Peronosclerospora sorghi TaxID=230839 RepID=A0ACC0VLY1_9STRA|nr:hypothetical protein PsorP6_016688 [Peronosclerospora sorghi]